jgi:hypothetical protein
MVSGVERCVTSGFRRHGLIDFYPTLCEDVKKVGAVRPRSGKGQAPRWWFGSPGDRAGPAVKSRAERENRYRYRIFRVSLVNDGDLVATTGRPDEKHRQP